ncbi:MAG TPA: hypothetical protein VMU73_01535 [Gaiellaceae bacterium]|nr:hypothetical protein [Gaiellaceae bacterium]
MINESNNPGESARNAAYDDPVAPSTRGEPDVGVATQCPVHDTGVRGERLANRQARLARLIEGCRLRAEPDVLPFPHFSCSCRSMHVSQRHENAVADAEIQTVVMPARS